MHPLLARLDRAAAYFGAFFVTALLVSASLAQQGADPIHSLLFVVPTFLVYALVCLSAWYVCRAVPLETGGLRGIAVASGVAALLAGAIWLAIGETWLVVLRAFPSTRDAAATGAEREPFLFAVAVILFLLVLSIHHVALAYEAARDAERQRLEFQVLTRDAELRALRAQLNPHFLYNSLNSISALTTVDADGARRMCVLLGDFLRNTLKVSALDRISLADELALVDAFLAIEQIRFGERLHVERRVDDTALDCRVPPLLLQPLMENAIGHGIAGLIEGGVVLFTVSRRDDRVVLSIENPRDADVAPRRRGGMGLENVRRRVLTAFGERARVEAVAESERFRVEVNLPYMEV